MEPGKLLLIIFTSVAAAFDLRCRRIPNLLILSGILCGIVCCLARGPGASFDKVLFLLSGTFLPLLLFGWLFYFRMIGAGDIKLLCMAGSFLGPAGCLRCIAVSVFAGGLHSAFLVLRRRDLFARLSRLGTYVSDLVNTGQWRPYRDGSDRSGEFCFSVDILLAVIYVSAGGGI